MDNFTTNTYEMKRDILLSNISEALDEDIKKAYTINRLSDNLCWDLDPTIDKNYCNMVIDSFGENPVFVIDDSDIIKPLGQQFEDLGIVTLIFLTGEIYFLSNQEFFIFLFLTTF